MAYKYPKGLLPLTVGFVKNDPNDETIMGINNDLHGGLKVVKTHEEMLAIPQSYLLADYTACFVTNDDGKGKPAFYYLTSEPSTEKGTANQDWTPWANMAGGGEVGELPGGLNFKDIVSTSSITITDGNPDNTAGDYYIVETPSAFEVDNADLFGGEITTIRNNDWIIYSEDLGQFVHFNRAFEYVITWAKLSGKPQVLKDFAENGTLPSHIHDSGQIEVDITLGSDTYTSLKSLLGQVLYANRLAEDALSAEDDQLLNYGQLKSLFPTAESVGNYVDEQISLALNNIYNKSEIDQKIDSINQKIVEVESSIEIGSGGIIGEVNSIAERDLLKGGDIINTFVLTSSDRIIAKDENGDKAVYVFTGGSGESGSEFWEFAYDYGEKSSSIKEKYESNPNTNPYTDQDKEKVGNLPENTSSVLSAIKQSKFKGYYTSIEELETTIPVGESGFYADVDAGVGEKVIRHIWDSNDNIWREGGGGGTESTPVTDEFVYTSGLFEFTLSQSERTGLNVFINGQLVKKNDAYTVTGDTLTLVDIEPGSEVTAVYFTSLKNLSPSPKEYLESLSSSERLSAAALRGLQSAMDADVGGTLWRTVTQYTDELARAALEPLDSTGSEIKFDRPRNYGTDLAPITETTLTENNTGAKKWIQQIYHQAALFEPPASWVLVGSVQYKPNELNLINVQHERNERKIYWIAQEF